MDTEKTAKEECWKDEEVISEAIFKIWIYTSKTVSR